jgi:hypothetical protein
MWGTADSEQRGFRRHVREPCDGGPDRNARGGDDTTVTGSAGGERDPVEGIDQQRNDHQ